MQGYGYLNMASHVPGCRTHSVETWRPLPTARQRVSEYFVGGAPELEDDAYVAYPETCDVEDPSTALNKLGTITERSGSLDVRALRPAALPCLLHSHPSSWPKQLTRAVGH